MAIARPMPRDAPVTNAVLPENPLGTRVRGLPFSDSFVLEFIQSPFGGRTAGALLLVGFHAQGRRSFLDKLDFADPCPMRVGGRSELRRQRESRRARRCRCD